MTKRDVRCRTLVSTLALLTALEVTALPHAAHAAEAAAADAAGPTTGLSEVVVTASRRQSTAIATPIDISAMTGADLTRGGVKDFQSLTRMVPGLVYNSASIRDGGATNSFIIHGLNLDAVSGGGDTPLPTAAPVSVYINETPTFVNLHLADVQRVEVLRGPQASLYGDASIAGTVRILFNEPDLNKTSAEISGSTGWTKHASGPNYNFDGVINRPINDYLGLRVAAGYIFDNGFIDAPHMFAMDSKGLTVLANPADPVHSLPASTSRKDIDNSQLAYVRPMLLFKKDNWKVLLTYQHQYEHSDGPSTDSYPGGTGAPTAYSSTWDLGPSRPFQNDGFDAAFPSKFKQYQSGAFIMQPMTRNVDVGSVEASYDLGFATLTSVTSGYETKSSSIDDSSGFYEGTLGFFYAGFPRLLLKSSRDYDDYAFTEEVRLVSKSDGPLTYSVGAFYMNERNHLLQQDVLVGYAGYENAVGDANTGTDLGYVNDRYIHFSDVAGFGELTYHVTPKLQITGGVRVFQQTLAAHSDVELPICGASCSVDRVNPLGVSSSGNRDVIRKALFKANASYEFAPHFLGYFTFSQGERRGGANAIPTKGPFAESPEFLFFKPDTVDNYELGLKGRVGGRIEFSSAFYYIDWQNPQVNVSTPNGSFPAAVNGKGAESEGVDLEGRFKLTDEITLSGTYAYNQAKLTAPIVVGGHRYGSNGTVLPGTPHNTASFGVDYGRSILNDVDFNLHVDASWKDAMTTSLTPAENVNLPAFTVLNASVGVSRGPWRASLFADNISNTRGVLSANNATLVTLETAAATGATAGYRYDPRAINNRLSRPLTIGLRFGYKYQ
ncbi:MAG: TonB-dependent receptor plug domain-containing protein [Caulobacteraceae bacterium]|nr:TonB-dependent receptor plug domain-containing protein [Caulobacteraceae bacterium]